MTTLKTKCKNMTQANKYVSNIINELKVGDIVENKIIKELVEYHPTKQIRVNNIEWLKIDIRTPFNKKALFYKYKNNTIIDDISWKLCIRNLYKNYKRDVEYIKDVKTAFRNESHIGTKKLYFISNTTNENNTFKGECNNCYIKTKNITTDHYKMPYKEIFDRFIENNNLDLSNIDIFENDKNEIRIKNLELASKWLKYHDDNAQYRLLCSSCNSHFGSYGY